ncbi:MAG: histidinol dehydrogenase [Chloroflexota bacterium]|jgi:histidinol dehydrogenase|nr:histidinol dehydrogenase [Chloroflexota bacterium]
MTLDVPVLTAEEWQARVPRRRFSLPDLRGPVLARLGKAVGRDVPDALSGVEEIIRQVRDEGDVALRRLTLSLDGAAPDPLELPRAEWQRAGDKLTAKQRDAIVTAAVRIEEFHSLQRPKVLGEGELILRPEPLRRVGIYVPGGRARYPSTVLMNAIPARIAGVSEILMVTPPAADGSISPAVLYAAKVAGVSRIFRVGGAQAIAALAYGTESIPAVDKITGPGNVFVVLAKRAVFGVVGIDSLAGPSEILVVADASANAEQVVADMASQLEHDPQAWAVLLTDSPELAERVAHDLSRDELASRFGADAAELHAAAVVVPDIATAIHLAAEFAPEHLALLVEDARSHLLNVRGAGMIFTGQWSPVPMGDYVAGSNHTLPTGGAARFASPLGVHDFYRWTTVVSLKPSTARQVAPVGIEFAKIEGLVAHQRSLEVLLRRIDAHNAPPAPDRGAAVDGSS